MCNILKITIMKKMSVLVKQVLMSTLTAGLFAVLFTACSDDTNDLLNEMSTTSPIATGEALQPVGLMYTDFINEYDVCILNADTTEIAISKAFAEKKGLDNFVNRPMGIWLNLRDRSFLRKGLSQRLEGNRYIIKVTEASIAEVLQDRQVTLKSDLYLNAEAAAATQTRGVDGMENSSLIEAVHTDDEGCIHPVAVRFIDDGERSMTRSGVDTDVYYSSIELLGLEDGDQTRSWGDIWKVIKKVVKTVGNAAINTIDPTGINAALFNLLIDDKDSKAVSGKLISQHHELSLDKKISCGTTEGDSLSIKAKIPVDFDVDCILQINTSGKSLTSMKAAIEGDFSAAPEVRIGFSKKVELPEDMQKFPIKTFPSKSANFVIYGIPVNITFTPKVFLKAKAEVEGFVNMGVMYEFSTEFCAGAEYKNGGWNNISRGEIKKNDFSLITPQANFTAEAGVGLMLACDIMLYNAAGPSIAFGPQFNEKAKVNFAPGTEDPLDISASCSIALAGEVSAKIKVFEWNIGEWKKALDFGLEKELWRFPSDDNSSRASQLVLALKEAAKKNFGKN